MANGKHESTNEALIMALRILSQDVISEDGVANAALAEASERMEQLRKVSERYEALKDFDRFAFSIILEHVEETGKDFDDVMDEHIELLKKESKTVDYYLLQPLPFLRAGIAFNIYAESNGKREFVVDGGAQGRIFNPYENGILNSILENRVWVERRG